MAVWSTGSLPNMAVFSSESLPPMPGGSNTHAVNTMESLPSMPEKKAGNFRRQRGGRKISQKNPQGKRSDALLPEEVQALRRAVSQKVRQREEEKLIVDEQRAWNLANQMQAAVPQQNLMCQVQQQREADTKVVKEPDVDPVISALEGDDEAAQRQNLDWIISSVWPLALTSRGSRILQTALDVGSPTDQSQILSCFSGHVQEAMRSPHANYVLQKAIQVMAPERVQLIFEELKGDAVMFARHRFGCRILQRLIEHCPLEQTEDLVVEVLSDVDSLCRHQFGNFVIQHVLQHGSPVHKECIAEVLKTDVIRLAKHRIASHVVSCALVHCALEDVRSITQIVLADADQLADLSRREYGSFVVREVNRVRRMQMNEGQ